MKYLASTLILIALSVSTLFASSDKPSNTVLNDQIKKQVNYPEFAKSAQLDGMVMVKFNVNSNGDLTIEEMNASCPELAKHVQNKLQEIHVDDLESFGTHFVKFNFTYVET